MDWVGPDREGLGGLLGLAEAGGYIGNARMSQEVIIGIVAAAGVIFAAVISAPRILRDERWGIQRDLEIWKALPKESAAREDLLKKIDREVKSLDVHDQKRRNPAGVGLGISFFAIGAAVLWLILIQGSWWWFASPIALALLIFGLAGFGISVGKTLRDEKGNTIKSRD
jgi:hypothetical protein